MLVDILSVSVTPNMLAPPLSELGVGQGRSEGTLGTLLGICLQGASTAFRDLAAAHSRLQPQPGFVNVFSDCIWKKSSG